MKMRPHYDGIWVSDRYWHEPEDYIEDCLDDDREPETRVEMCRVRPFTMDADWVIEGAYQENEVDPDEDLSFPPMAARAELQKLLDGWAAKHLVHWSFPTGDYLDITDLIEQRRRELRGEVTREQKRERCMAGDIDDLCVLDEGHKGPHEFDSQREDGP